MLTPTSSPASHPDDSQRTLLDGVPGGMEPISSDELGFSLVLDGTHHLPTADRTGSPPTAQIMPNTADGAARQLPPVGPWPVLETVAPKGDASDPPRQMPVVRMEVESTAGGASPQGDGTPLADRSTDSTARIPAGAAPDSLPVGGEVQRVELAVAFSRQAGLDARTLLPQPTAPMIEPAGTPVGDAARGSAPGVLSSLTTLAAGRGGVARITLDPPLLGTVTIQMSVHGGEISCTLHAGRASGAEALVRDIASLRSGLEAKGLVVDRLVVQGPLGVEYETPGHEPMRADEDEERQHEERRHRRRSGSHPVPDERWLFEDMLAIQPDPAGSSEGGQP